MNPQNIKERIRALSPAQRELLATQLNGPGAQKPPNPSGGGRLVAYVLGASNVSAAGLRDQLKGRLPDYMVPAAFVLLDEMPRLPNGKINLNALPAPEATAAVPEAGFASARSAAEQQLIEIWEQVLNIRPIGIHDNFFEIGGDSILSIQIVARARKAGLLLGPNQLFEHQTVAELALFAQPTQEPRPAAGPVSGALPLTPIQHWFFEEHRVAPHHWNQAMLFPLAPTVNTTLAEQVIGQVIRRHDALRLQFTSVEERWQAVILEPEQMEAFRHVDLSGLSSAEQERAIQEQCETLQAGLRFSEGALFQAAYFQGEPAQPDRLLLVAHHLLVDNVSWQILLQDVETALRQRSRGEELAWPERTMTFKAWSEHLSALSKSGRFENEYAFWLAQYQSNLPLPTDFDTELPVPESSMETLISELDAAATQRLLREAAAAYRMRPEEILLSALLQTFGQWAGLRSLPLGLERHGREGAGADIDLSHTVGWFTAYFPLTLHLPAATDAGSVLKSVKEQLRRVPGGGIGYGMLRYLSGQPEAKKLNQRPPVIFNYLGVQHPGATGLLGDAQMLFTGARDPRSEHYSLFEVNTLAREGRLQMRWSYSRDLHRAETVEKLVATFEQALLGLLDHCLNLERSGYTPSDFPDANLSQEDLDQLLGQLNL